MTHLDLLLDAPLDRALHLAGTNMCLVVTIF